MSSLPLADANYYARNSSIQYGLAWELMGNYAFRGNESILDIGCGDGKITAELAQLVPDGQVLGIDISPSMISFAKEQFPQTAYPNLNFSTCNAEELSTPQQFDLIVAFSSLHHIRNGALALQKMTSHLKPGGSIFLLLIPRESPFNNVLHEVALDPRWKQYVPFSAANTILWADDYRKILEKEGLTTTQFLLENRLFSYRDEEALITYFRGWIDSYIPLSSNNRELFLKQVAQKARALSSTKEEITNTAAVLKMRSQKL